MWGDKKTAEAAKASHGGYGGAHGGLAGKGFEGNKGGNHPQGAAYKGFGKYSANPTPAYKGTLGNLAKVGYMGMPGVGLLGTAIGGISGYGPQFTGPMGQTTGYNYDPKNWMGQQAMMSGKTAMGARGSRVQPPPKPAGLLQPPAAPIQSLSYPSRYIGVPGSGNYGAAIPGFNFFG